MDEALAARRRLIGTAHDTIKWPLIVAICACLKVALGVFGLLAPRNAVVRLTILIDDFDSPFDGLLHVSTDAIRDTLNRIDEP
jgi:hypothetical protein